MMIVGMVVVVMRRRRRLFDLVKGVMTHLSEDHKDNARPTAGAGLTVSTATTGSFPMEQESVLHGKESES